MLEPTADFPFTLKNILTSGTVVVLLLEATCSADLSARVRHQHLHENRVHHPFPEI